MSDHTDIAVVGAGPYGLSIAAHLSVHQLSFRVFGRAMETWSKMPPGMLLKSEGFASNLFDPENTFALGRYCRGRNIGYADLGLPVSVSTFCAYGNAFQRALVPALDQRLVSSLRAVDNGFVLELEDGEKVTARRVVVATGITNFAKLPAGFSDMPKSLITHSSDHSDLRGFRDKAVVVVGGGSSAIDLAALLHEAEAEVQLITRRATLPVHTRMRLPRTLGDRLCEPMTGLGPSWRSLFFVKAAPVVRLFPPRKRVKWARNEFGPSAGWFMADRIRPVPVLYEHSPVSVEEVGSKVRLNLVSRDRGASPVLADHVIMATGYRPDLDRVGFLAPSLRGAIDTLADTPVLSAHFESSVPGLYFVGPLAANSFGPLMRFAFGAGFTSRRLARHLVAKMRGKSQQVPTTDGRNVLPSNAVAGA